MFGKLRINVFVIFVCLLQFGGCEMSQEHTNRLIHEKSPYLLQHAHNPVDWFAWGEEAFEKARKENKPIFLSIGYATCHWCHVMERESFKNDSIAAFLNEHFVAIKVDREERPDVDMIYMTAVQSMTGQGGWPLTAFLNHELEPFFGGTYFPPQNAHGRPGFPQLLQQINTVWQTKREQIEDYGDKLREVLNQEAGKNSIGIQKNYLSVLESAYQTFSKQFDSRYGGFGSAPKFPRPMDVQYLLRYHKATQNQNALDMAVFTLDKMAAGGMYDQIGGGFHRYSTDERWLVPHFEKMLYDNALLALAYTEAFQVTKNRNYERVVNEILEFISREMTDKKGGFYSAQDADSEEEEGKFYVWSDSELKDLLIEQEYEICSLRFGVTEMGNFEHKTNIFYQQMSVTEVAKRIDHSEENVLAVLNKAREKLFQVRNKRIKPITDDKVLTSWSALMISAFSKGYAVFQKPEHLESATKALEFILTEMKKDNILLHRYRDGEVSINGFLEDYAFLIQALIDYYEVTFELNYLKEALVLLQKTNELFYDQTNDGYFFSTEERKNNLVRMKDSYDGAVPSGNSIMVLNLLRLAEYTMNDSLQTMAEKTIGNFSDFIERNPLSFAQMLNALDFKERSTKEIVVAKPKDDSENLLLDAFQKQFYPNRVIAQISENRKAEWQKVIPWTENRQSINGQLTAYVCENYTCQLPTTDVEEFLKQLEQ